MGGLAVLFLLGFYCALTLLALIYIKPFWAKAIVLILALLIPSADALYGRIKLKQMCAAEAGLKVYKVAHNVEGFMDDYREYWILEGNYKYSEDYPINGTVTRYSMHDGKVVREKKVSPQSQYRVSAKYIGSTKDRYLRHQFTVESIQGDVLATDTQIAFNGGWAEKLLAAFSDAGGGTVEWCTNTDISPLIRHQKLVLNTLKYSGE
ncbi:MAG: hypothetical protein Q8R74_06035 [Methylophilus sp.]|nr:hypothetical protein [Methylophilus sp.]